jgi:hypothetical protein
MDFRPAATERAFVLAASGRFRTVGHLRQALTGEGYPEEGALTGREISRQLRTLIHNARAKALQEKLR